MSTIQTYSFWQLASKYQIEVPIIQRDYAQGRKDKKSKEIRTRFTNDLLKSLRNKTPLELDFVYGKVAGEVFVPIDGQQRLTTLFLLHWYLANRANTGNAQEIFKQVSFTYKTRVSARDFCEKLSLHRFNFDESNIYYQKYLLDNKIEDHKRSHKFLSFSIKSAAWFFLSWQKDPTVQAMLKMLDAIHVVFKNEDHDGFWLQLTEPNYAYPKDNPKLHQLIQHVEKATVQDNHLADLVAEVKRDPVIAFKFLNLDDFQLTDELYLKMNARGRPLSSFENFKAWLIGYVEEQAVTISDKDWTTKFDKSWTDLFWRHRIGTQIDKRFLNFINGMVRFGLSDRNKADDLQKFSRAEEITLSHYEELKCFTEGQLTQIFKVLDFYCSYEEKLQETLRELHYWSDQSIFRHFINEPNFAQRIQFFAIVAFIERLDDQREISWAAFKQWCRVTRNLIENTVIDGDSFTYAVNEIKSLAVHSQDIYTHLAKEDTRISFFLPKQVAEEKNKARIVIEQNDWEAHFIAAENHKLLRGQLSFLIPADAPARLDEFFKRRKIAESLFTSDGSREQFKDNYLLIRAMLSQSSVNSDITLIDNAAGWRTLLRNDHVQQAMILLANQLIQLEPHLYPEKLRALVDEYADQNILWRYYLIKNKALLYGKSASISNVVKRYNNGIVYLYNNDGGNWINNYNQIQLSNRRNEIIDGLIKSGESYYLQRKNDLWWWVIKDDITGNSFYRGDGIGLTKQVAIRGQEVKLTLHFESSQVVIGVPSDDSQDLDHLNSNLPATNNWKFGKSIAYHRIPEPFDFDSFFKEIISEISIIINSFS